MKELYLDKSSAARASLIRTSKHLLRRRFAALLLQLELPGTLAAVLLLSAFIFKLGLGTVAGLCLWQLDNYTPCGCSSSVAHGGSYKACGCDVFECHHSRTVP